MFHTDSQRHVTPQLSAGSRHDRPLAVCEALSWSLLVRVLLQVTTTEGTIHVLDRLPYWHAASQPLPRQGWFRLAGACLSRSIAQSQYLRQRNVPHTIIVGVRGSTDALEAHAWVDLLEQTPPDFHKIWRIERGATERPGFRRWPVARLRRSPL